MFLAALLVASGTSHAAPLAISGVLAATLAGAVLFGLPGGALADRLGAGRGLPLGAVLRLVAIAAGVVVIGHPTLVWLVAFAYSAASQVFSPAEMACVRMLQHGAPTRAHAALVLLQYGGQGLGVLLAPALLLLGGPTLMLLGAIVLYGGVAALATLLMLHLPAPASSSLQGAHQALSYAEPLRFFGREPRAVYALGLLVFTDLATKSAAVALPRYLQGTLALAPWEIATLLGTAALGAAAGLLWISRVRTGGTSSRMVRLSFIGTVAAVIALVSLSRTVGEAAEHSGISLLAGLGDSSRLPFALSLPSALLLGLFLTAGPIGARALLTATAPAEQQARVFAAQTTLTHAVTILPLLLAGVGAQYAGPEASLAFIAVLGVAALVSLELTRLRRRSPALMRAPA